MPNTPPLRVALPVLESLPMPGQSSDWERPTTPAGATPTPVRTAPRERQRNDYLSLDGDDSTDGGAYRWGWLADRVAEDQRERGGGSARGTALEPGQAQGGAFTWFAEEARADGESLFSPQSAPPRAASPDTPLTREEGVLSITPPDAGWFGENLTPPRERERQPEDVADWQRELLPGNRFR